MFDFLPAPVLAGCCALFALDAGAQPPVAAPVQAPGNAPVVALAPYRSAFEGYRPFGEQTVAPWRASNDLVGAIGGWRAYAKEAQAPDAGVPAAANPHAGHAKP